MLAASLEGYRRTRAQLERHLGDELLRVVLTASTSVNSDLLPMIYRNQVGELEGQDEFGEIRQLLLSIKTANRLNSRGSPIYILRPSPDYARTRELEFVVMSDPDAKGEFYVGNRYAAQAHNLAALEGQASASPAYTDSEGAWISASAPLRDRQGHVTAILQADWPVDFLEAEARKVAWQIMMTSVLMLAAASLLAAGLARSLAHPVFQLVTVTKQIAAGVFDQTVNIRRNDELGDLANSINGMASQLKEAQWLLLRRQEELANALAAAEAGSRAKSQFMATISHELRTPLNGVLGCNALLMETALDSEQMEYAETIRQSAAGLFSLLTNVLEYANADVTKVENVRLDLRALFARVEQTWGPEAAQKGLALTASVSAAVPLEMAGDSDRLWHAISHLVENAIKFTARGEINIRARVESAADPVLLIEVQDTGVGIDAEATAGLFEPFQQGDGSSTRAYGGLGLGLALCRQLVAMMKGTIGVSSQLGEGSTFWIRLPLRSVQGVMGAGAATPPATPVA